MAGEQAQDERAGSMTPRSGSPCGNSTHSASIPQVPTHRFLPQMLPAAPVRGPAPLPRILGGWRCASSLPPWARLHGGDELMSKESTGTDPYGSHALQNFHFLHRGRCYYVSSDDDTLLSPSPCRFCCHACPISPECGWPMAHGSWETSVCSWKMQPCAPRFMKESFVASVLYNYIKIVYSLEWTSSRASAQRPLSLPHNAAVLISPRFWFT